MHFLLVWVTDWELLLLCQRYTVKLLHSHNTTQSASRMLVNIQQSWIAGCSTDSQGLCVTTVVWQVTECEAASCVHKITRYIHKWNEWYILHSHEIAILVMFFALCVNYACAESNMYIKTQTIHCSCPFLLWWYVHMYYVLCNVLCLFQYAYIHLCIERVSLVWSQSQKMAISTLESTMTGWWQS